MLPASNQGVGENTGFPDTCNTPIGTGTSPITYPNFGSNSMAMPFLPTVLLSLMPGHNQNAKPLMTNGDSAGVAHSSFMQSGGNNLGNVRILLSGGPAETLTNPAQGNNYNCSSNSKLVPSLVNILMGDLGGAASTPVRWALPAPGLGWLRLARCSAQAPALAAAALRALEARGARALVLDLRGNPGGLLGAAAQLAALFLPPGAAALEAHLETRRARWLSQAQVCRLPLVLLVDAGTASAAEGLAAALQEQGRALVVGEPSHGKAQVARPVGAALGALLRPGGLRLDRVRPQRWAPPAAALDVALGCARQLAREVA